VVTTTDCSSDCSAATLCKLVGAMQTIECIAISEAFMVCHLLKIDKSQLLRVLHHGSAKSDVLTPFSTDSSKGVMLPSKSTLDNWQGLLEVVCTHASDSGFSHTLPRTAIASIATLSGELKSVSAEHAAPQEPSSKAEDSPETSPDDVKEGDKVLVIGLGLMGIGIAKQLSKHVDTLGYDIDESRTKEFAKDGGRVCENVQEDCREAAFVVVVVESEEQIHEALFDGPEALSENLKDDATIIIHSTVSPGHASKVQERFSKNKPEVVVLDAPMSGTPTKAEQGQILVWLLSTSSIPKY
jgi:3-hydroxyisobutyrate dehydrogenase-like beta-hydroxyacid dehydrogenase